MCLQTLWKDTETSCLQLETNGWEEGGGSHCVSVDLNAGTSLPSPSSNNICAGGSEIKQCFPQGGFFSLFPVLD